MLPRKIISCITIINAGTSYINYLRNFSVIRFRYGGGCEGVRRGKPQATPSEVSPIPLDTKVRLIGIRKKSKNKENKIIVPPFFHGNSDMFP